MSVISVTLAGIVMDLIDRAPQNTNVPILFVPSGNTTDSNELSELKTSSSTVSIDLPKCTYFNLLSIANAPTPIYRTVSGRTIASQYFRFPRPRSPIAITGLPLISFGTRTTLSSEVQL